MERLLREARRRTKVFGAFPDGQSALLLVAAQLRHVSATRWGTRKCMNMKLLDEMEKRSVTQQLERGPEPPPNEKCERFFNTIGMEQAAGEGLRTAVTYAAAAEQLAAGFAGSKALI